MTTIRSTLGKRVLVEVFSRDRRSRAWDERLAIDFNVDRTKSDGKLGSGRITLRNLNDDSIGLIRSRRAIVRLTAGFIDTYAPPPVKDYSGLIFTGVITRVAVDDTTTETNVQIEAEEGYGAWASIRVNTSWAETDALTVARSLARDAGYILDLPNDLDNVQLPDGYIASGLWRTEWDNIIKTLRAEYSIEGGILRVVKKGGSLDRRGLVISNGTGMVGKPRQTGRNNILVRTSLNPAVRLRQIIRIDTTNDDGTTESVFARVLKFTHTGSSWDNPFFTDIEARKLTS